MCGVFGVRSVERDVARLTYFGLFALQHRGQESAGIAVYEGGRVTAVREMGLVPQVFDEEKLAALPGEVAIGHTRYSTTGGARWANAQPLVFHGPARTVALGHNGNLVDPEPLREELLADGVRLASSSDTEVIAALLARDPAPLPEAVAATMKRLEGAYSIVAIADGVLVAFRDPLGIRPLTLGRVGDDWVVASETCALDLVGADVSATSHRARSSGSTNRDARAPRPFRADAGPRASSSTSTSLGPTPPLDGTGVHAGRVRMGERLAEEAPVDADFVMPIPDSGTPAAIGFAKRSGIPYEEGLIKNRYVGRTFIEPDQELRRQGIRLKFNPLAEIAGRRIVVVDDSIVRGNTMRALVQMLFGAGAAEVHVRISSPPVVSPCFYGIDMADEDELAAAHRSVEEMREHVGASSLHYLSLDGMQWATGLAEDAVCRACFTRDYPTRVPEDRLTSKLRFEPAGLRA